MKKAILFVFLLGLIASGGLLFGSSTYAQGESLAVLDAQAGVFQVRDAAGSQYSDVSGIIGLNEGTAVRWEPNAVGSIDFFNGLDIPVSTTGNTASEIVFARLDDTDQLAPVSLLQTQGRVTYSLRSGLDSGEFVSVESQSGAAFQFADGTVELVEGAVIRDEAAISSFSWRDVSSGNFTIGSFSVDLANTPACGTQSTPRVMVYNPGSATAPTRVGVDGNMRFTATNPDLNTELVIGELLLVVDGIGDVSICSRADQSLQITANNLDQPMGVFLLETGEQVVSVINGASLAFDPFSGNPLAGISGIVPFGASGNDSDQQQSDSLEPNCPSNQAFADAGRLNQPTGTNGCPLDTELGNPDYQPPSSTAAALPDDSFRAKQTSTFPEFTLYQSDLTGNLELYRFGEIEGDPVSTRNLSQGGLDTINVLGALSPNRQFLTFASNRAGSFDLYMTAVDGSLLQRITVNQDNLAVDINPVWSPDGTQIVYQTTLNGNWDLRAFDVATGEGQLLTNTPSNELVPQFSPDGSQVMFISDRPFINEDGVNIVGRWQIYALDIESGEVTRLSDGTANDYSPTMSASGDYLAFVSDRSAEGTAALFVAEGDGSNPVNISGEGSNGGNPVWAEDQDLLVFAAQPSIDQSIHIYTYDPVSAEATQMTTSATGALVSNITPTFDCADPSALLLSSNAESDFNLYSISLDATEPVDPSVSGVELVGNELVADVAPLNCPLNMNNGIVYLFSN